MIYVTGDCHGDYQRFTRMNFKEQQEMSKEDYVIITGDFGLWKKDGEQEYWLNWLDEKPFTTLWIDGNHENFDLLKEYPKDMWNGGEIHKIRPTVLHLMRGQVYTIEGKKFFTFGGASSHDISDGILEPDDPQFKEKKRRLDKNRSLYRIHHISWWKEELPNRLEYETGLENLKRHNNHVDYIITHCCATSTQAILSGGRFQADECTDYLEFLKHRIGYRQWYFGHYHQDKRVSDKETLLYKRIERVL